MFSLVRIEPYTPQVFSRDVMAQYVQDGHGTRVNEQQFRDLVPDGHAVWVEYSGEDAQFPANHFYLCKKVYIRGQNHGFQFLSSYTGFGTFGGFNSRFTDYDRTEWLLGEPELDASVFGCVVANHNVSRLLQRRAELTSEMNVLAELTLLNPEMHMCIKRISGGSSLKEHVVTEARHRRKRQRTHRGKDRGLGRRVENKGGGSSLHKEAALACHLEVDAAIEEERAIEQYLQGAKQKGVAEEFEQLMGQVDTNLIETAQHQ